MIGPLKSMLDRNVNIVIIIIIIIVIIIIIKSVKTLLAFIH